MNIKHVVVALALVVAPLSFAAFRPIVAPPSASTVQDAPKAPSAVQGPSEVVETLPTVTIVGRVPVKARAAVKPVSCKVRSLLTDYAAQVRTCDTI